MTWTEATRGKDAAGHSLIRQDAEVVVVDKEKGEMLGEGFSILGKEPPKESKSKTSSNTAVQTHRSSHRLHQEATDEGSRRIATAGRRAGEG